MAKMTLLEMTQNILLSMESDFVNDIGDTVESDEVSQVIKETYYDLINNILDLPEHEEIINLTGLSDTSHPNYFQVPTNVKKISLFRYNNETATDTDLRYVDVDYLTPYEFQELVNSRTESDSNVTAISDFNAGQFLIVTDKHPQYWSSFDDKYLVCDSYLSSLDSTLVASKTFCFGLTEPTWTHSNSFVPDLDANLFPLLLAEAKSTCFVNFKQVANASSERKARRQLTKLHNKLHLKEQNHHASQPNYGRK